VSKPVVLIDSTNRVVSLDSKFTVLPLDASQSYSPGNEARELTFVWGCDYYVKVGEKDFGFRSFDCSLLSSDAGSQFTSIFYVELAKLALAPSRLIDIASDRMIYTEGCVGGSGLLCDPSVRYRFNVAVCDASIGPDLCTATHSQASVASVEWGTTPAQTFIDVNIAPLKSNRISNLMSIKFMGEVKGVSSYTEVSYLWVQMESNGTEHLLRPENLITSIHSANLVTKSGLLQGEYKYRFRLYASLTGALDAAILSSCNGMCGWAEIEVQLNMPPHSGKFTISPAVGEALSTPFTLTAEQWQDQDLPMKHTFSYTGPDGICKYMAVLTSRTALVVVFPPGSAPATCPPPDDSVSCTSLSVRLTVTDSLGSAVDTIKGTTLSMPVSLRPAVFTKLEELNELAKMQDGVGMLSLAGVVSDLLNQFPTGGVAPLLYKQGVRSQLTSRIDQAVKMLVPMSVGTAIHSLGSIWAVCGKASEVDPAARDIASSLLEMIGIRVLNLIGEGDTSAVVQVPTISILIQKTLGALLTPVSATGRRSGAQDLLAESTPVKPMSALQTIASVERLSRINVAGHVLGQAADVTQDASYQTVTQVVTEAMLSNIQRQLVGSLASSSSLASPQVVAGSAPVAAVVLPADVTLDARMQYEVQTSLLYANPLAGAEMQLLCPDETQMEYWDSSPVNVSVNNMGELMQESMRTNVVTYIKRRCSVLGNAVIVNLRKRGQSTHVSTLGSATPISFRLPFDPLLRNEGRLGVQDKKSGHRTTASCLYWDSVTDKWSNQGIEHAGLYMGNSRNASGAYVECTSNHLSTFAVSEVPADCKGTPFGTVGMDDCGVCGGDNSQCSGCDGAPNSGRTKDCSGHGRCAGDKCSCSAFYHGVICQVYCDSALNCSGHGVCTVDYEGLSMATTSYCACESSYAYPSSLDFKGKVPVPTCVMVPEETYVMPQELLYGLTVGAPCFLVCCSCCLFWFCISRTQAKKVKSMQEDLDRFMVSHDEANKMDLDQVEADLCMPFGPTNFKTQPNRGDEMPLYITMGELQHIKEVSRVCDNPEGEDRALVHSSNMPGKGFLHESDSDEDDVPERDGDLRAERMRRIRNMRMSVSKSAAAGPQGRRSALYIVPHLPSSGSWDDDDIEVPV